MAEDLGDLGQGDPGVGHLAGQRVAEPVGARRPARPPGDRPPGRCRRSHWFRGARSEQQLAGTPPGARWSSGGPFAGRRRSPRRRRLAAGGGPRDRPCRAPRPHRPASRCHQDAGRRPRQPATRDGAGSARSRSPGGPWTAGGRRSARGHRRHSGRSPSATTSGGAGRQKAPPRTGRSASAPR